MSAPQSSSGNGSAQSVSTEPQFKKEGVLAFLSADGKDTLSKIDIEIASSENERAQGLMHRTSIQEGTGMLFIFDRPDQQSFWMKNTPASLDIIFVDPDRKIINYHEYTTPFSEQNYPSKGVSNLVVEVVGGYCKKHNIKPGDRIAYTVSE